jgi:hypothetical protein
LFNTNLFFVSFGYEPLQGESAMFTTQVLAFLRERASDKKAKEIMRMFAWFIEFAERRKELRLFHEDSLDQEGLLKSMNRVFEKDPRPNSISTIRCSFLGRRKSHYTPDEYLAKRNIYVGTSLDDIFDISASDEGMSWNDTIDGLKEALAENISRAFPVLDEYADNDSDGITFAMMISISWFALMFFLINAMLEGDKGKAQKSAIC